MAIKPRSGRSRVSGQQGRVPGRPGCESVPLAACCVCGIAGRLNARSGSRRANRKYAPSLSADFSPSTLCLSVSISWSFSCSLSPVSLSLCSLAPSPSLAPSLPPHLSLSLSASISLPVSHCLSPLSPPSLSLSPLTLSPLSESLWGRAWHILRHVEFQVCAAGGSEIQYPVLMISEPPAQTLKFLLLEALRTGCRQWPIAFAQRP